jgi:hypothetical protein
VLWLGRTLTERVLAATTSLGRISIWKVNSEIPGSAATLLDSHSLPGAISIADFNPASRHLLVTFGSTVVILSLTKQFFIMRDNNMDRIDCEKTIRGAVLLTSGTYALVTVTELKAM